MIRAYVGLGANLGDAAAAFRAAVAAIDALPGTDLVAVSRVYRSAPWGRTDQPAFLNAAVALETTLAAGDLLRSLHAIERAAGRDRSLDPTRWGPRVLDLDLLLFGDLAIDTPGLQVPHPYLRQRAFALVPLFDVAPDLVFADGTPLRAAVEAIASDGIEAVP
ncbi:MAG TPA: 2-amino-4-hydroxy-6-hydroxymethyldihydropteridine diphosphokinase [Luteimonas sp.]|nr:2-amino-4-hydroxy-6-hydroxymethyldihydropteridine diphosphokinase [Luteimonas sp.]